MRKAKDETEPKFEGEDKANLKRDAPDADIGPAPKRKRGGRKKKEKFMDDDLLTAAEKADKMRRSDRWIPDIGLRRRVATKPESVPHELWMSYCMMDEYIYRQSLTDDEVTLLPFIDEVFIYKQDGPKPKTPPGFCWDAVIRGRPRRHKTFWLQLEVCNWYAVGMQRYPYLALLDVITEWNIYNRRYV